MDTRQLQHMPTEYRDALRCDDVTPPEFLINPDHPEADDYLEGIVHLKRALVAVSSKMSPSHVQIVKKWFHAERTSEIAASVGCSTRTVYKAINSVDGQRLYALLQHLAQAIDGPNEAERRAMLWRMARIAESRAPKTAISAISELNRMTMSDYQRGSDSDSNQPTVVVLNQTVIPRGALD